VNVFNNFLILILLSFVFSCSILKPVTENNQRVILNGSNISILNGTYHESPIISSKSNSGSLYWSFFLKGKVNNDDHYKGEEFIRLQVVNSKKISVSLIREGSTVESKILKGRINNNTFEFKRRWKIYPLIFSNVYKDSKTRVSLLQNGNLSVDSKTMVYGTYMIFIPIFDVEQDYNLEFKKI
jgi:hypothetical protein